MPLLDRFLRDGAAVIGGVGLDIPPLEDPEDTVSRESVPCSRELDTRGGRGGTASAGARNPFLVAGERDPNVKSPLAFGAEATRRMKREAEAPTDFGVRGPFVRDLDGVSGAGDAGCEGLAVSGTTLAEFALRDKFIRCLSDLVWVLDFEGVAESASLDSGCRCCEYVPFCWVLWSPLDPMPPFESLDCVFDEL